MSHFRDVLFNSSLSADDLVDLVDDLVSQSESGQSSQRELLSATQQKLELTEERESFLGNPFSDGRAASALAEQLEDEDGLQVIDFFIKKVSASFASRGNSTQEKLVQMESLRARILRLPEETHGSGVFLYLAANVEDLGPDAADPWRDMFPSLQGDGGSGENVYGEIFAQTLNLGDTKEFWEKLIFFAAKWRRFWVSWQSPPSLCFPRPEPFSPSRRTW